MIRLLLTFAVLATAIQFIEGCKSIFYVPDPKWWNYVEEIGSAKEITEWALEQTDAVKLDDALIVLSLRAELHDEHEAVDALDGMLDIYTKLRTGWLGLLDQEGEPIDSNEENYGVASTMVKFASVATNRRRDAQPLINEMACKYFFQIRPMSHESEALKIWKTIGQDYDLISELPK